MGVARQCDHLTEYQLGDGNRIAPGLIGDPDLEFLGRFEIDPGGIDADTGARNDLEPTAAALHMIPCELAFAADHRIHPRYFDVPALRLDPGIDHQKLDPRAQPFENVRLEFLR